MRCESVDVRGGDFTLVLDDNDRVSEEPVPVTLDSEGFRILIAEGGLVIPSENLAFLAVKSAEGVASAPLPLFADARTGLVELAAESLRLTEFIDKDEPGRPLAAGVENAEGAVTDD